MGKSSKLKQREADAKEAAFRARFVTLSRAAQTPPPSVPLLDEFRAYDQHFLRSPAEFALRTRSSSRAKQVLEMARHLFGRFRVPRILEQAWSAYLPDAPTAHDRGALPRQALLTNLNLRQVDFRAWFVCVATGGSLYKLHTKTLLTKKETHTFLGAPPVLGLCQAVIYAVARCAGAPDGDAQRLARSKLAEKPFGEFWFDVVRFFCLPEHMPATVALVNDLCDYLDHRHREEPAFRLLGSAQTLPAILRRMEQWHRALARAKDLSGVTWAGVALPDHRIERPDPDHPNHTVTWDFHQITSGKELAAEGTAMRHCVFGYKNRCVNGDCSIWSLTRTDAFGGKSRRLTLEVSRYGVIVQKRGLANRAPRSDEAHLVAQWALAMNLDNRVSY